MALITRLVASPAKAAAATTCIIASPTKAAATTYIIAAPTRATATAKETTCAKTAVEIPSPASTTILSEIVARVTLAPIAKEAAATIDITTVIDMLARSFA